MKRKGGFTLIEILVSISAILLVTAIALPTVKDSLKSNTVARSASTVRGAFMTARAMAMQTGKPCGVLIERRQRTVSTVSATNDDVFYPDSVGVNFGSRLSYVQVPSSYPSNTGVIAQAYPFVTLTNSADNCSKRYYYYVQRESAELLYAASQSDLFASQLIKPGTVIRTGNRVSSIVSLTPLPSGLGGNGVVVPYDGDPQLVTCGAPVVSPNPLNVNLFKPGVLIQTTDYRFSDASLAGVGPEAMVPYAPVQLEIQLDPIRSALAPLNLPGRSVIDLSVSGSRANPLAFGSQEIVGNNAVSNQEIHGVIVMFAPDGRLDSVYLDRWVNIGTTSPNYVLRWERQPPPSSLSLLVGFSDGVMQNVEDGANYPESFLDGQAPFAPDYVPNFTNSDCHWVTVDAQSGRSDVSRVTAPPKSEEMRAYYGWPPAPSKPGSLPPPREIMKKRLDRSKQISFGGNL